MIYPSDRPCFVCFGPPPTARVVGTVREAGGSHTRLCADCLIAALETITPWKWAGVLASYRAGAAVKAALDNKSPGRKLGPHARKRAKEVSDGLPL